MRVNTGERVAALFRVLDAAAGQAARAVEVVVDRPWELDERHSPPFVLNQSPAPVPARKIPIEQLASGIAGHLDTHARELTQLKRLGKEFREFHLEAADSRR